MATKLIVITGIAIAAVIGMCILGKLADGKPEESVKGAKKE